MLVSDFDYDLPERLIAQEPSARRDGSRLLVVNRASGELVDSVFTELPDHLRAGDLLVLNNTRVFPARLIGRRLRVTPRGDTILGGRVEVFLVSRVEPLVWEALVKPGRALTPGARVEFARGKLTAEVIKWRERGRRVVRFEAAGDFDEIIDRIGRTPLPPYIKRDEEDRLDAERYQTVFARERGAVAAPTAGLHFTPELLERLRAKGIQIAEITLHVGYGTFQPVRVERVEDHRVEPETYSISEEAAAAINRALIENRRVIAVGTTTTRALESAASRGADEQRHGGAEEQRGGGAEGQRGGGAKEQRSGGAEERRSGGAEGHGCAGTDASSPLPPHASAPPLPCSSAPLLPCSSAPLLPRAPARVTPGTATTDLFIYPGFEFRVVSGLVTNYHLPRSSLLMLVSAFAGREMILGAYDYAVEHEYRFYSYGDAMLIL
jgi:S-adenosylmethionine:tRNA ribosyltransferase-isomerase